METPIINNGLRITRIKFREFQDQIGELRINAWKNEYGIDQHFFSQPKWIDEIDTHPDVFHWAAFDGDTMAAAGRLSLHHEYEQVPYGNFLTEHPLSYYGGLPIASINRLVVDHKFRGKGLARILDEQRIEFALQQKASIITAQPMAERVSALGKLGFEMITEIHSPFQIPGRRIFFMIKQLNPS